MEPTSRHLHVLIGLFLALAAGAGLSAAQANTIGSGVPGVVRAGTAQALPQAASRAYKLRLPVVRRSYWDFVDNFEGTLDGRWSWHNEDPGRWSLTARHGYLSITSDSGGLADRNLLLQPAPAGDFDIRTRVRFTPTSNYQGAGLVLFQDGTNFLFLTHSFCDTDPPACAGNAIYFDRVESGNLIGSNYAQATPNPSDAYLWVARRANTYTAYWSLDGSSWTLLGQHTPNPALRLDRVGVSTGLDLQDRRISADFDFF